MLAMFRLKTATSLALSAALMLTACANTIERLENIGQTPDLSPIAVPANVAAGAPVILPNPPPSKDAHKLNSLWRSGSRSFFRDPRAAQVGDILTVNIDHVLALETLLAIHKDPFDRLLVAQANVEGAALISVDPIFAQYPVNVLW